jgi:hypothetical protein
MGRRCSQKSSLVSRTVPVRARDAGTYRYDEQAVRLRPDEWLHFHRQHSQSGMDNLRSEGAVAERRVEPNSDLGKAISYLLNRGARLTLFLQRARASLDTTWRSVL